MWNNGKTKILLKEQLEDKEQQQKKTFEKKRTFLTYFLYFNPIRITKALLSVHKKGFSKTVLLIVFCTLQNINSIFTTMYIKQSIEYL